MKRIAVLIACLLCFSPAFTADSDIVFTEAEHAFIAEHPEIHIGVDPKFIPFEFFDENGSYKGIASDILSRISTMTGLTFSHNPDLTWSEAVTGARNGTIDLLPAVGFTEERSEFLTYLKPYMQFQRAAVVRKGNTSINALSDLWGRQVAVQGESSHEGFLAAYPEIGIRRFSTVEEALLAVNRGDEVAFIGNEATSAYLSRTLGLSELKFITLSESGAHALHMAVRKDLPELASILQKALDAMSESEYSAILGHWIHYENRFDYTRLIRISIFILSLMLLLFAVSSFWIVRLRRAVKEKELAQQQAENSDREKGMFMARISHEIRTPLNGVRGMSYLLEKTKLDTQQSRYLQAIKSASQSMQVIIHDILEYSRLNEGQTVIEHIPFRVDDVLQDTISLDAWKIREKGLDFRLDLDPSVPPVLIGDPTRLRQVLTNFLHNAVKFTCEGRITLSLSSEDLGDEQCLLTCAIHDTGIGMSEKQIEKLFTPFIQADESIHRKYGGSGLGLSISKHLVEAMQGSVEVESREGKGSTFRFSLPLRIDTEGMRQELQMRKSVDFSSLHALLVIPDRELSAKVARLLTDYGVAYEEVSSLAIADSLLSGDARFDLVILELAHPGVLSEPQCRRISRAVSSRLLFVHEESEGNYQETDERSIILPLPLIHSVFFNALLQLFGKGGEGDERREKRVLLPPVSPTVLVVEDNRTNQMIARELLEREGCTVLLASDGKEGHETFLSHEKDIDVILMDLHMEGMDGYESTRLIRKENKQVPILILSADLVDSVREKCEQMAVNGFIGKPYDPDQLIGEVFKAAELDLSPQPSSIDSEAGMKRVGGDAALYKRILSAFALEMKETLLLLRESIGKEDARQTAECVHKCKGACGSVGAKRAHELCVEAEKMLKGDSLDFSSFLLSEMIEELSKVIQEAEAY